MLSRWNDTVGIVDRLQTGWLGSQISFSGRGRIFFPIKYLTWLWPSS